MAFEVCWFGLGRLDGSCSLFQCADAYGTGGKEELAQPGG